MRESGSNRARPLNHRDKLGGLTVFARSDTTKIRTFTSAIRQLVRAEASEGKTNRGLHGCHGLMKKSHWHKSRSSAVSVFCSNPRMHLFFILPPLCWWCYGRGTT